MKTLILIGLIFIGGCVSAKYNSETGDFNYSRFGPQSLKNIELKTPKGGTFKIGSQEADPAEIILEAIKLGGKLAETK